MVNYNRISFRLQIRSFKNTFFQVPDLPFRDLLPDHLIQAIHRSGNCRDTVFTPLITLRAFIFQVLSSSGSCKESVAHVLLERIQGGFSANSVNTGPYCKARSRLSLAHLIEAVTASGRQLHRQASKHWLWRGYRVMLVDGTTMLMPDTADNQQTYPQQSNQKPRLGFPIMRVVGLLSLTTGSCVDYALGSYQGKGSGETSLFSQLIQSLSISDLLIADRYYTTYAIMALLNKQGTAWLFRQRANSKTDFRCGIRLGAKDHLIRYSKPKRKPVWIDDDDWEALPNELVIREFSFNGVIYVTSLTQAKAYPKKALAELYQQRWQVELNFRTLKTQMGMEMLRCQTADMVNKEVAEHLLAYNLIRANLARAASLHDEKPSLLSFMSAVQLIRNTANLCFSMTGSKLGNIITPLLKAMTETKVGQRERPNQPRAIKRRPKAYPLLKKPRRKYATA